MTPLIERILPALGRTCWPAVFAAAALAATPAEPAIVKSEFIAEHPPFPASHASTIVELNDGTLLAGWFGGSRERALDVEIWLARNQGQGWSAPEQVANGIVEAEQRRYPCWNPVLFQRRNGELLLFYKVGPSPEGWWGMIKVSKDKGQTWSKAKRLPHNIIGPVRNKPIELADGMLLCGGSSENAGWRVFMQRTKTPRGTFANWIRTPDLNQSIEWSAIQPTILAYSESLIQILCRTKQGKITQCWSSDGGISWSDMTPTALPNPNSAIDAVLLKDGHALLVYNHTTEGRSPLNLATSADGKYWQAAGVLEDEPGEFSYPAVIQTRDGLVHVTYTWNRQRIKHVVLDPAKLQPRNFVGGQWPK